MNLRTTFDVEVHFLFFGHQHLQASEDQEGGEDVEHPAVLSDEGGADADHDAAQQDHAEDAPEQHAVLITAGESAK